MTNLPPGLAGFVEAQNQQRAGDMADLQQATTLQALLQHAQAQKQEQDLRALLVNSGGDAEKAVALALSSGNVGAAHALAPLAALAQKDREKRQTREAFAALNAQQPGEQPAEPVQVAGPPPAGGMLPTPQPSKPGATRVAWLNKLAENYADNPVVMQRIQSEIDKIQNARPLIEQNFPVGKDLVQPHISHDNGETWTPIPGSVPSAKFAGQVVTPKDRLVPVKGPDGRVTYVPESQAGGLEVGGRTTDVNLPKQVQQLGRDFEKAGLNQSIAVVDRAGQITPEQAKFITGPGSLLPDRAVPQDVREARQALSKLFNITLKDRSGAAVTLQELERLKNEFGSGVFKTAPQLLNAIREARNIIESHYQGVAASYGPDVLSQYNTNLEAVGGTPFKPNGRGVKITPTQPGAPQAQETPSGGYPRVSTEADYDALPSGAVYIAPDGKTKRKR